MEGIQEGIFSGGGILRSLSRKFRKTSSYDWNLIAIVAPGGATGNRICFVQQEPRRHVPDSFHRS